MYVKNLYVQTVSLRTIFLIFSRFRRISLTEMPEHVISSKHRAGRIEQLIPADTFSKVRNILGDTADKDYPLYRHPRETDPAATVATGMYFSATQL